VDVLFISDPRPRLSTLVGSHPPHSFLTGRLWWMAPNTTVTTSSFLISDILYDIEITLVRHWWHPLSCLHVHRPTAVVVHRPLWLFTDQPLWLFTDRPLWLFTDRCGCSPTDRCGLPIMQCSCCVCDPCSLRSGVVTTINMGVGHQIDRTHYLKVTGPNDPRIGVRSRGQKRSLNHHTMFLLWIDLLLHTTISSKWVFYEFFIPHHLVSEF